MPQPRPRDPSDDMDPEVFRAKASRVVDWIADCLGYGGRRYPVLSRVGPGEVFLSHTRLDDGVALRVAIGNLRTTRDEVTRLQAIIEQELGCPSGL